MKFRLSSDEARFKGKKRMKVLKECGNISGTILNRTKNSGLSVTTA